MSEAGVVSAGTSEFYRMRALFWVLFVTLVGLRLPTLAQPAGADQELYAYVGQTLLRGGLPYLDAWDQKPPAVHYSYALMYALWSSSSVVAATDLIVALAVALTLLAIGRRVAGRGAGEIAALVFLVLGNPAFTRLGGVRVRSQCETFVALLVALAVFVLVRQVRGGRPGVFTRALSAGTLVTSGALVGLASCFKYNAVIYLGVVAAAALWLELDRTRQDRSALTTGHAVVALAWLGLGAAIPVLTMLAWFAGHGALGELYRATVAYNVQYSGETYEGPSAFIRYLATFPIQHARIDGLWFAGGLGCLVLLAASLRDPRLAVWPLWVAVACLSIAINGSRGLPQYFVQAHPALAMAAGVAAAWAWPRLGGLARIGAIAIVGLAVQRVADVPKVVDYWRYDVSYWRGQLTREQYLSRFGERASGDKFSALAVSELAAYLTGVTQPDDAVLLFGFSPGALVQSNRISASRFFWSRPVIVGFAQDLDGYGAAGVLAECERTRPTVVVLQRRDWDPDTVDSATFFLNEPSLRGWLDAHYGPAGELGNYLLWHRAY